MQRSYRVLCTVTKPNDVVLNEFKLHIRQHQADLNDSVWLNPFKTMLFGLVIVQNALHRRCISDFLFTI